MADPRFYVAALPLTLKELAELSRAEARGDADAVFTDVAPLAQAGPDHVSFLDNMRYADAFSASKAGACIVRPDMEKKAPEDMALLLTDDPYGGYARVARAFYPPPPPSAAVSSLAVIDETASLGRDCRVDAGAVIGPGAEIGHRCHIGAHAVIGEGVVLGDDCLIGPSASLACALVGKRVIIHAGACIGQDGFGFAPGAQGHLKVPQLGRVIIEDDVEIGANTTIDRGTGPDTVIGEGAKIDNLVQIAHNVRVGRGCMMAAQVGISGSTTVGDFSMIGGQAGFAGHLRIGDGTRIAAQSGLMRDVEAGSTVGGSPAVPMRQWLRGVARLERMAKKKGG
ncbi:MAG: UDP-3-O-(3-hydroxymyristoyl)glucosamine N-acyltransferase [Proteobacteria bacterium]|nr:UDP-3-O-(3-hydroxymyristoyl)glucosamine N-acyltransferase [Pseudomonadota bacterium]